MAPKQKGTPPPGLSAADVERLDTWMPEIADKSLGHLHARPTELSGPVQKA